MSKHLAAASVILCTLMPAAPAAAQDRSSCAGVRHVGGQQQLYNSCTETISVAFCFNRGGDCSAFDQTAVLRPGGFINTPSVNMNWAACLGSGTIQARGEGLKYECRQ